MLKLEKALAVAVVMSLLFGGNALAQSSETLPQTPDIKTEQQADRALEAKSNPDTQAHTSADATERQNEPGSAAKAENNSKPKEGASETSEFWMIGNRTLKITDTLLVAFTFLLFLATVALFWATRDLVDDAKHNAERQLRAYVGVNNMNLSVYPLQGQEFAFIAHIEMRNFGQTPAHNMRVWAEATIDGPEAKPFDMSKEPARLDGGAIVFPSAGFNVDRGWAISASDKEALLKREKFVFLWGSVRYTDAFGKGRYFRYRMQSTGQILVGTTGTYAVAPLDYESN